MMNGIVKEPKYKFEPKEVKTITDKNGTILLVGNRVEDTKGKKWKLENIGGVTMLVYPVVGAVKKTQLLSKVDFKEYVKVA